MVASVPGHPARAASLYKQAGILMLRLTALLGGVGSKEHWTSAMASVPKLLLLLLLFWSCHSLVAHAGDDRSYRVLSLDSLNSDAVCSEPKGAVLSVHVSAVSIR
jgi:hypothetical protein